MYSKRVLHALAVFVTILLFLVRRALIKSREHPPSPDCVMCMSNSLPFDDCVAFPKYKKDPDIKFDDEDIGKYPREY